MFVWIVVRGECHVGVFITWARGNYIITENAISVYFLIN